jgi:hypothetical protein
MTESQKKNTIYVVAALAVAAAAYSFYASMAAANPKEEIVGTLDMGPKGGRDAEKASGDVASGMPAEMGGGEGKQ